jgi:hypothetical protein
MTGIPIPIHSPKMMVAKGNDCGKIEFAGKYIEPAP